jgi:pyrroloquinoline quinone (PQQ) biosynthesis protein C
MADILESPYLPLSLLAIWVVVTVLHYQRVEAWRGFCEEQIMADTASALISNTAGPDIPSLDTANSKCLNANPYQDREAFADSIRMGQEEKQKHRERLPALLNRGVNDSAETELESSQTGHK